ncbi:MAG: alanine--tRNA ligase-related protein [Candidatus Saccharimonadales bacterium]
MTKLLYMEDFDVTSCEAKVVKTEDFNDKQVVVLDQTCFYAKGGGQDFDQGRIKSGDNIFKVEGVFFIDGEVKHIGEYESGSFSAGDSTTCEVDKERRALNTRIHSGGHTIDMAMRGLGWSWTPGKGAHYPDMAFVEYSGEFNGEQKQKYISDLQAKIDELVTKGSTNTLKFMTPEEMKETGATVPDNLPKGKPSRVVFYDDFAVPCGGTHVKDIKEISKINITNIKRKNGSIRVSYKLI